MIAKYIRTFVAAAEQRYQYQTAESYLVGPVDKRRMKPENPHDFIHFSRPTSFAKIV
jgi:hypothetical protein